ncbi:MAG: aminotransferase class III-fold pyridoxal phosphate-dependent enzyme [candidate division WOR-3 bacterium]|nr:aminotransferase class III-fold pyridoxal phosphate-dependent enzyme [candidate division WOR-3 bacterium]
MNFLNIYPNIPVQIKEAEGCYLISDSNKKYLDLIGGLGVNILGYHNLGCERALSDRKIVTHISNLYLHPLREKIAGKLNNLCGMDKTFFTNSGTESNEAALKFAWKEKPGKVLAFEGSFHGRTLGSFSLSHLFIQQDFPRIDTPVEFVYWNDPDDLRKKGKDAAIVIFEPIQGAGGVRVMNSACFDVLKELQNKGAIIITDEIQSGLGRTGSFLASSFEDFHPDIVTLGKGLGGGLPLGAVAMKERVASNLKVGDHGTTMGGNLLALQLAEVVLEKIENGLMRHNMEIERNVVEDFREELGIRGRGLQLGFDVTDGKEFADEIREKGYLVNVIRKNTVRLLPPYIIKEEELREFFKTVEDII